MKFSVLMSVYKNDNPIHFRQSLESVSTMQTVKPNQIVIVQDGPVSNEINSIIKDVEIQFTEIEFTILRKEKQQGLAAALNDGLEKCKYEYIARMDADDVAVENRFELQITELDNNKQIDILGGYIAEFDNNPDILGSIRKVGLTQEEILKMAKHRCPFNHMTVIYKKSKVLQCGGYNTEFGKLEDYKLWVDMIKNNCICQNLPCVLIKMRVGNGMIQRRSNPREITDWDRLQMDLLEAGIVKKFEVVENKIYIRVFTYMPVMVKKFLYSLFLRSR